MSNYRFPCEWCNGTVGEKTLAREIFRHARGFVILENATIGLCDKCGHKYYSAALLHRVEEIALNRKKAEGSETIPVAHA